MCKRTRYACAALTTYVLASLLFIYGSIVMGVFSPHKILVTTLQTTGPDFEVVLGIVKLKIQVLDSPASTNVLGIMTTGDGLKSLNKYLADNYMAYSDYFVLSGKMQALQKSDGPDVHPLIHVTAWFPIHWMVFWALFIADMLLAVLFLIFYQLFKKHRALELNTCY
jgi:hypothetical protein